PHRRTKNGAVYEYWSLVKSVRTERGPRQKIVASIGKMPGLDRRIRMGWEQIGAALDGRVRQADLFEDHSLDEPEWATVDISRLRVERLRDFGDVYLALALWRRLRLDQFFNEQMFSGRAEIPWALMACILTVARFCAPSSELKIAEHWYGKTALEELLGIPVGKINDDRLYRALDEVLPKRDALFSHLQERYTQWFGTSFDFLLYDITSTYFEGNMAGNPQAKRGHSRDIASGGGAKSDAWLQIKSDIFGIPFARPRISERSLLGVAMLGGVATRVFSDPKEAVERFVKVDRTFEPNMERHKIYLEKAAQFRKVFQATAEILRRL
ncbi:MAG: hypothetical protein E4H02_13080, partial [Lentisphaerales bacterium]